MKERIEQGLNFLEARLSRNWLIGLAFVAVAVRVLFVTAARSIGDPNSMDAQNYLEIADNLLAGNGFALGGGPTTFVAPLYPAFLAVLQAVFGKSVLAIKLVQAVIGGLSSLLVFDLARRFVRPGLAFAGAGIFALHPEMIAVTAFLYTETLFIFLALCTFISIVRALKQPRWPAFFMAGVLLGITSLCRGTLYYLPVFLVFLVLLYRQDLVRRLAGIVLLTAGMAVIIAPWAWRNYTTFHAFVPIATGAGDVFWTGNYLPFDGEFRYRETQQKIKELVGGASLIERDRILMAEAKKSILAHPAETAWLWTRKFFRYWFRVYENVPRGEKRQRNWLIWSALAIPHYVLLALTVVAFFYAPLRRPEWGFLLLLFGYYTLIHVVTLPVPRYRMPLIPLMAFLAVTGFMAVLNRNRTARLYETN